MKRGFSLIEMLAAMAISSVVFSVIGVSLHALRRAQMGTQDEMHTAAAIADFARRLRADAHASCGQRQPGDVADAKQSVDFEFSDGHSVVYDFDSRTAQLRRRVVQDGKTVQRETFVLPPGSQVEWNRPVAGESPLLAAVVARPTSLQGKDGQGWRKTRIEAAISLDTVEAP